MLPFSKRMYIFPAVMKSVSGRLPVLSMQCTSAIHTTSVQQYPGFPAWRKKRGLPANHNAYGPLTDGPDYSFLDGRQTPPGSGMLKRAKEQKEISMKIIQLDKEVDDAVALHEARLRREEEKRASILEKKLKPKGNPPPGTHQH